MSVMPASTVRSPATGKATLSQHQDRIRPFLANNTFLGRFPGVVIDALVGKGQLRSFARATSCTGAAIRATA